MDDDAPPEYYCPISLELMSDPVIAMDGNTYERQAIQDWIERTKPSTTSPKTNAPMEAALITNRALKALIDDWRDAREKQRAAEQDAAPARPGRPDADDVKQDPPRASERPRFQRCGECKGVGHMNDGWVQAHTKCLQCDRTGWADPRVSLWCARSAMTASAGFPPRGVTRWDVVVHGAGSPEVNGRYAVQKTSYNDKIWWRNGGGWKLVYSAGSWDIRHSDAGVLGASFGSLPLYYNSTGEVVPSATDWELTVIPGMAGALPPPTLEFVPRVEVLEMIKEASSESLPSSEVVVVGAVGKQIASDPLPSDEVATEVVVET